MSIMATTEKWLVNNGVREWARRRFEASVLLLGAAVWLLSSTGVAAPGAESLPTTPVKVPAAIQDILAGDTSKSYVSPEEGALVIICMAPTVEKQSMKTSKSSVMILAQLTGCWGLRRGPPCGRSSRIMA